MPSASPDPDVAIGRHPDHGIVAANPTQHHIADWYLDRLGFHRVPGHPFLYALQAPPAEATQRAAHAGRLMQQAGLTVHTDLSITSRASDPDVAIADHPRLGIVAATNSPWPALSRSDYALRALGWQHQPALDIYTLPAHHDRPTALTAVANTVQALQDTGHTTAVQPALAEAVTRNRTPAPSPSRPGRPPMSAVALAGSPARSSTVGRPTVPAPVTLPPAAAPALPSRTR